MNERIKLLRKALNLGQIKFANKLGYSYAAIQNWEKGKNISEASLNLIEKTFNVNPNWLRTGTGNMFNNVQDISFNGELLELVVETVEEIFISNQLSLNPNKKAKLIRLLYEYMDKQVIEDANDGKIIKLQDYFNTKYKNYIINMVSSL